jgi:GDP-4-dehydro-6-deoxy-D-mannose reductase
MRALITGSGGFCGRHLLKFLQGLGVEVHTLGAPPVRPNHHLADPVELSDLITAVRAARPDYVFHLAGVATGDDYQSYYRINTVYAAGLLSALAITGQDRVPVLLTGTAAEYGLVTDAELPITEDAPPRPYNHYGVSKLAQTQMGSVMGKGGRPLVMVRPFNIIGPGMPPHLALASFAQQLLEISRHQLPPMIEVGNLESARDFIDVKEVVDIYWRLIRQPAAYGQIVNVCSGKATRLGDLLSRLISISGLSVEVRSDPARFKSVDIANHYGSREKLIRLLGYTPCTNLDTSLTSLWNSLAN